MAPARCVVDTNVVAIAGGMNSVAGDECRLASAVALQAVMAPGGHLFLDASGLILDEYLGAVGTTQPEAGGAFVKWVLQNLWVASAVTHVPITPRAGGTGFQELNPPAGGTAYDPSDEKFLAVSAAHPEHPPVLQAFDSKWWGWQASLEASGVRVHFLCPDVIKAKFDEKIGA